MKTRNYLYILTCCIFIFTNTYAQSSPDFGQTILFHQINYNQNQVIIKIFCTDTSPDTNVVELQFGLENHDSNSIYFQTKTHVITNYSYQPEYFNLYYKTIYDTLTFYHPTYIHDLKLVGGNSYKINQSWKYEHCLVDFQTKLESPYNLYNTVPNGYYLDSLNNNWIYGGYYGGISWLAVAHPYYPANLDSSLLNADYIGIELDFIRIAPHGNSPTNYMGINYAYPTGSLTPNSFEEQYTFTIPENSIFHVSQLVSTDSFASVHFGKETYYDNIFIYPVYNQYICPFDSLEINGVFVSDEGLYIDSLFTTLGTDSIVGVNLKHKTIIYGDTLNAVVCAGNAYLFQDTLPIYNPGLFTFISETAGGCDSVFYLNLETQNNMIPTTILNINGELSYASPQSSYTYQWYNVVTNSPIAGETNPQFTPHVNGTYVVEISDGICTQTSDPITTSIGLQEWKNEISLLPNPFSESITIKLKTLQKDINVLMFDVQSKQVYKNSYSNVNSIRINTETLTKGIYYITLQTKEFTATRKVICK